MVKKTKTLIKIEEADIYIKVIISLKLCGDVLVSICRIHD